MFRSCFYLLSDTPEFCSLLPVLPADGTTVHQKRKDATRRK